MKVVEVQNGAGKAYIITSPATGRDVLFDERWTFNDDFERPTFRPSMLCTFNGHENPPEFVREHFFVTDGKIQYLPDCHHDMAGKTVDMIDCKYGEYDG